MNMSNPNNITPCQIKREVTSGDPATKRRLPLLMTVLMTVWTSTNLLFGAPISREIVLFRYQGLHEANQWVISEVKILATPEWDIDAATIPIAPERAWRIAKDCLAKKGFPKPQLVQIQLQPFVSESESTQLNPGVQKRYYYRIQCSPAPHVEGTQFDCAYVFILMDGSVLEPKVLKP